MAGQSPRSPKKGECLDARPGAIRHFRVRLAAERWQKARHLPKAKREDVRRTGVASIESAILDLDTLQPTRPTVERVHPLGSSYKRLAQ
ncbi:MAG: hypothetical protein IPJ50_16460, partial [Betaproteobacteria bacterium]|nr:hypothetical protein [Betaproteobacteria bacterium]